MLVPIIFDITLFVSDADNTTKHCSLTCCSHLVSEDLGSESVTVSSEIIISAIGKGKCNDIDFDDVTPAVLETQEMYRL